MKKIFCSLLIIAIPVMVLAQASGGQIKRNNSALNKKVKKVRSSNYPRFKVISEKEKTCELVSWSIDYGGGRTSYYPCINESYKGSYTIPSIVNGYTVVRIGDYAFTRCEGITSVKIPSTIKEMGKRAFYECKSLKNVFFCGTITTIPMQAFYDCESLESINLPYGLVSIEAGAFDSCI